MDDCHVSQLIASSSATCVSQQTYNDAEPTMFAELCPHATLPMYKRRETHQQSEKAVSSYDALYKRQMEASKGVQDG